MVGADLEHHSEITPASTDGSAGPALGDWCAINGAWQASQKSKQTTIFSQKNTVAPHSGGIWATASVAPGRHGWLCTEAPLTMSVHLTVASFREEEKNHKEDAGTNSR